MRKQEDSKSYFRSQSGKPNRDFPLSLESNSSCVLWITKSLVTRTLQASPALLHILTLYPLTILHPHRPLYSLDLPSHSQLGVFALAVPSCLGPTSPLSLSGWVFPITQVSSQMSPPLTAFLLMLSLSHSLSHYHVLFSSWHLPDILLLLPLLSDSPTTIDRTENQNRWD